MEPIRMSEVKERKTVHMKIIGMSCSSCVGKIERHMAKQRGNASIVTGSEREGRVEGVSAVTYPEPQSIVGVNCSLLT